MTTAGKFGSSEEIMLRTDDVWPRNRAHRYRLYLLQYEKDSPLGEPDISDAQIIAAAPDLTGIGTAFGLLLSEGEVHPLDRVGVLDTDEVEGTWIVNPYA